MDGPTPAPRTVSAAVLVPLLGLLLWMPPLLGLFAAPWRVFGVPLVVAYLFGVWLLLIAAAWALARRLVTPAAPDRTEAGPGAPPA